MTDDIYGKGTAEKLYGEAAPPVPAKGAATLLKKFKRGRAASDDDAGGGGRIALPGDSIRGARGTATLGGRARGRKGGDATLLRGRRG